MTHTVLADHLIEYSATISRIIELVDIAASGRINVLIAGKPDAGHGRVARAVHGRGTWPNGPFVKVDCSKRRGADLELELFGVSTHDGEAGPTRDVLEPLTRTSRLYQASRGTLFLEHLTAMPLATQARLSRLLDRREALVGPDQQRVLLDIHTIVADDPHFERACDDGRLRTDLHEHVCGLRIDLPSLDTQPAHIPALAGRLLEDICHRAKVPRKELTSLAQILLAAAVRPCNALELWLLLEDLVTRVPSLVIRVEDVLANVLLDGPLSLCEPTASLREARERFERKYIAAVLERHRGRIPHAARTLGIERTNLYRKLRHLDVGPVAARTRNRGPMR